MRKNPRNRASERPRLADRTIPVAPTTEHEHSISIGSIRLESPERDAHVPRTLPPAKLKSRPTFRKSGVFERSVFSSAILSFYISI